MGPKLSPTTEVPWFLRTVAKKPIADDTGLAVFLVEGTAWSIEKASDAIQKNADDDGDVYIQSTAKDELNALLNQAVGEKRCAFFGKACWSISSAENAQDKIIQLVDTLSYCKFNLELHLPGDQDNLLHHVILRNAVRTAKMLIEQHRDKDTAGISISEVQDAIDEIGGLAMHTSVGALLCANYSQLMCDVGPKNSDGIAWVTRCFFEF